MHFQMDLAESLMEVLELQTGIQHYYTFLPNEEAAPDREGRSNKFDGDREKGVHVGGEGDQNRGGGSWPCVGEEYECLNTLHLVFSNVSLTMDKSPLTRSSGHFFLLFSVPTSHGSLFNDLLLLLFFFPS